MNVKRILCPVDFSKASDLALKVASGLARQNSALLFIVHVEEPSVPAGPNMDGWQPSPIDRSNHPVWRILPSATNVKFQRVLLAGDPTEELLKFAREKKANLIVAGTHGRTGIARLFMGSVAEGLVRRATIPVLTVKQPSRKLEAVSA